MMDRAVIIAIPETRGECIASGVEWTIYDEHAKAFIITATKMRLEADPSRPEVILYTQELAGRDGQPLRGGKSNGKFISIDERLAWTQEYLDWFNGDHSKPWEGEIYNIKEFRYLVHRFVRGFHVSAFNDPAKIDPACLVDPDGPTS